MHLSKEQLIIPEEKLKQYLLVYKERNDKSGFLKSLGFELENWQDLAIEIAELAVSNEVRFEKHSEFGNLYSVLGKLRDLEVVTIWFHLEPSNKYRFVTLFPNK
jgi:hypothetical protein